MYAKIEQDTHNETWRQFITFMFRAVVTVVFFVWVLPLFVLSIIPLAVVAWTCDLYAVFAKRSKKDINDSIVKIILCDFHFHSMRVRDLMRCVFKKYCTLNKFEFYHEV